MTIINKEEILSRASKAIELNESPVPIGRTPRALRIGGLAAGLGLRMVTEIMRRIRGKGEINPLAESLSLLLSKDNVERIVSTLTRMRGAALKVGQMLSIQEDGTGLLPPIVENIFTRLRDSAHQMPKWQMQRVMEGELGSNWMELFHRFDEKPFAAASIGQVHRAWIKKEWKGRKMEIPVAVKVQYPNIAESITNDLDNVQSLLLLGNFLPSGLYLDNTIKVVQRELKLETDYEREASFMRKFSNWLNVTKINDHDHNENDSNNENQNNNLNDASNATGNIDFFHVPQVHLATKKVLVMDFIEDGIPIDRAELNQEERNFICTKIFELTMRELFVFNCMQTDPNWSNFLLKRRLENNNKRDKKDNNSNVDRNENDYENENFKNRINDTGNHQMQIGLIDFGATREFSPSFVHNYQLIIEAAANRDRKAIEQLSIALGFMTGNEAPLMTDANTEAILALGEPFVNIKEPFDFGNTDISQRIKRLIPTMLQYRMTAPPDESYSLHRKLSGIFQLCAKMKAKIPCNALFRKVISEKGNN